MPAGLSSSRTWSREEDKAFENAIATHWIDDSKPQWKRIASKVPNKTMDQLIKHFHLLVEDVNDIDAGIVPLPKYNVEKASSPLIKDHRNDKRTNYRYVHEGQGGGKGGSKQDQERRKGIPWSEEEHRLFLLGLDKYGKGDWRSISRNFVISRTPTQVASHAQKYFIRLNSMNRDRRRSSIHDITSVDRGDVSAHHQAPITGEQPTTAVKERNSANIPGMSVYGAALGHPVAAPPGHIGPAIGTPVMLPPGHHPPYVVPASYPMEPIHK